MFSIQSTTRSSFQHLALLSLLVALLFSAACSTGKSKGDDLGELAESGGSSNVDALREFEEAVALWEQSGGKDHEGVRAHLERALKEDRRFGIAWFNLGVLDEARGDLEGARKAYEEAARHAPRLGQAHVNLGVLELNAGDRSAARSYFEKALEVQPYNPAAHNNMSVLLREEGNYDEAVSHARRSLAGDSQNTNAYANLARVYYDQGNTRVARLVIFNAMQLEAQIAAEKMGIEPGEDDDGESEQEEVPEEVLLSISNPDLYNILGMIELRQNDVTSAIIRFREALARDPDYVPALLNLGAIILNVRDYDQALELFGRVLELEPGHKEAMISTAVAYRGKGDLAKARETYEEILSMDPEDAATQFNLGVLEHEHLAQNAQLGMGTEPSDPSDPVAMMDWTINNMQNSIGHYERALEHYRDFLHYEKGQFAESREDATNRISQIGEIMDMLQEQIPMLREQRDMLAEELAQIEQASEQDFDEMDDPWADDIVDEDGE